VGLSAADGRVPVVTTTGSCAIWWRAPSSTSFRAWRFINLGDEPPAHGVDDPAMEPDRWQVAARRRRQRIARSVVVRLQLLLAAVRRRLSPAGGVVTVEYALVVIACAVAIIAAVALLEDPVRELFTRGADDLGEG
jgi:Flp pilus assembly pilin Flp